MKKVLIYITLIGIIIVAGMFWLSTMKYELKMLGTSLKLGIFIAGIILLLVLFIKLKITLAKNKKEKLKEDIDE